VKVIAAIALCSSLACAPQRLPDSAAFDPKDTPPADAALAETAPDTGKGAGVADASADGPDPGSALDTLATPDVAQDAVPASEIADVAPVPDLVDGSGTADWGPEAGSAVDADTDIVPFVAMDATPCADPAALPGNCTTCTAGFVSVATATGSVCAADFPLWGPRPDAPPPSWFTDTGKGTVSDGHSGRTWAKDASPVPIAWDAANGYCAGLSAGGHDDWRLPTLAELLTIRDVTAPAPTVVTALANTPKEFLWTASPVAAAAQASHWTVLFNGGTTAFAPTTAKCYARCVR